MINKEKLEGYECPWEDLPYDWETGDSMFKAAAKRPLKHDVDEIESGITINLYGGYLIIGPDGEKLDEYDAHDASPTTITFKQLTENCDENSCLSLLIVEDQ